MGITVREAMAIGGLTRCKVVAGDGGLDREIEHITVMEVPDVIQWLKGKDLLLTSLYPIKDDEQAIRSLVRQLADIGSAALAIKPHRFVDEIPAVIRSEGDRLKLPIIEIENSVSYLDIMTPLMSIILNQSAAEREDLKMFFQLVTELAMGGKGISAIVKAVEQAIGNRITVESELPFHEGIAHEHDILPLSRLQKNEIRASKRSIRMLRSLNGIETPCIVTPILLDDELYGSITCWQTGHEIREQDFMILDRVIPLLAMEFLKVKTKIDVEQTFKDDFLADILLGEVKDKEAAMIKAQKFGWDLTKDYQVVAIDFNAASLAENHGNDAVLLQEWKRKLLRRADHIFTAGHPRTIVGLRKDTIAVLLPADLKTEGHTGSRKERTVAVVETLRRRLQQEYADMTFTAGVGRFGRGIEGIHSGYLEAEKAVRLGKLVWGEDGTVHFDDLGVYRILGQFHDRGELEAVYSETIGTLAEYDDTTQSHLVETLAEYFRNNCALAETADKLFIHANTLKYRLQKIEQLTGCSIHDAEQRLRLHIGLKIRDILRHRL